MTRPSHAFHGRTVILITGLLLPRSEKLIKHLTFFLALPPDPEGLSFFGFDEAFGSGFLGGWSKKKYAIHV